ncbi:pepsin/retropepsin-like aspartic protease family protein [Spirosoma pomorum]
MNYSLLISLLLVSVQGFTQTNTLSDTIAFAMNEQNNLFVKAVFNRTDTLNLNFDTGTTELVLTNSVLKGKLKTTPKLYSTIYELQLGQTTYLTKVYDAELTAHQTDGRFGWDLFKNKIVEVDYDKSRLIIHSALPSAVAETDVYTKLDIEFAKDLMLVKGSIEQDGITNKGLFLFDTGYQRTVMLDNDLLREGGFPIEKMAILNQVVMKGAQGNEIPVITANLGALRIGKYQLTNVPVQRVTTSKPLKDKNIHILGNEVLKRFNTFLDLQRNVVYMTPNHLYSVAFTDQLKKNKSESLCDW